MSISILKGLHRRALGLSHRDQVVAQEGFVSGGEGKPAVVLPGNPQYTAIWEDFLFQPGVGLGAGSDTGTTPVAIAVNDTGLAGMNFITRKGDVAITGALTAGTNGVFRFTTANVSTDTVAGSTAGFVQPNLNWKLNQGKGTGAGALRFGVRLKESVYSRVGHYGLFVGFTDTTATEMPFHDTGDTADVATASNGFGIGWNSSGDTGWVAFAVDGNTVQQTVLQATTPTNNVYVTLEMEATRGISDTGGKVNFYIDGVLKGSINNPCNVSTALTPCVYIYDTGAASNLDVDWVAVSAPRDTGL
jgi:hypothetical protein